MQTPPENHVNSYAPTKITINKNLELLLNQLNKEIPGAKKHFQQLMERMANKIPITANETAHLNIYLEKIRKLVENSQMKVQEMKVKTLTEDALEILTVLKDGELLDDPITYEPISPKNAFITPTGQTFAKESILDCLTKKKVNPISYVELNEKQLRENHTINNILLILDDEKLTNVEKVEAIKLNLSANDKFFKVPVVADDGKTYEHDNILKNGYINDKNIKIFVTEADLYPNLLLKNIIEKVEPLFTKLEKREDKKEVEIKALPQQIFINEKKENERKIQSIIKKEEKIQPSLIFKSDKPNTRSHRHLNSSQSSFVEPFLTKSEKRESNKEEQIQPLPHPVFVKADAKSPSHRPFTSSQYSFFAKPKKPVGIDYKEEVEVRPRPFRM